jgi:cell division protein DivIC
MKRVFVILAIVICLFIVNSLARSIWDTWSKRDLVEKANKELLTAKKDNQKLKSELEEAKKQEFIESQARNKLLLVKPGEEQVIVPQEENKDETKSAKDLKPNWQKWWEHFF